MFLTDAVWASDHGNSVFMPACMHTFSDLTPTVAPCLYSVHSGCGARSFCYIWKAVEETGTSAHVGISLVFGLFVWTRSFDFRKGHYSATEDGFYLHNPNSPPLVSQDQKLSRAI